MTSLIDTTSATTTDAISTATDVTADLIDAAGDATADLIDAAGGATALATDLAANGARFAFAASKRSKGALVLFIVVVVAAVLGYRSWQSSNDEIDGTRTS